MNQRFLNNYSIVVIKHFHNQEAFHLNTRSFIKSSLYLNKEQNGISGDSLFYIEIDGGNNDYKVPVEFGQTISLKHKYSNKYLSFSDQFEEQQNDTTYKIELSHKKCYFKILPCFQYQKKISSNVKFNEDIYLAIDINSSKEGYISTRYNQQDHIHHMVLGLHFKSKFLFHFYNEFQKEQLNYIYGSIVWLTHVESSTLLTVKNIANQNQIFFKNLELDKDRQEIAGLWLIESEKSQTGGKICFEDKIRLKNLSTSQYLAFIKNTQHNQPQNIYDITLEQIPTEKSKFTFKSLKGDDNQIKIGSYLIFRHCESKLYLGCRNKNITLDQQFIKPITNSDFDDQDLYKLIILNKKQRQAIRFIFSTRQQMNNIIKYFKRQQVITNSILNQMKDVFLNIKKQLQILSEYQQIFIRVQIQFGRYMQMFCFLIKSFRKMLLKQNYKNKTIQIINFLSSTYKILHIIVHLCRNNQIQAHQHIACFVQGVFKGIGAQQLMIAIYSNNYDLLHEVSNQIDQLDGQNIVRAVLKQVLKGGSEKDDRYWINLNKVIQLIKTFICNKNSIIDINQRLIAQELFGKSLFQFVFFGIRINSQKIKVKLLSNNIERQMQIHQIRDKMLLSTVQQVIGLFSLICAGRNLISKRFVHSLLNQSANEDAVEVIISYLNDTTLPKKLCNNLYSLMVNLYIDSSPRIERNKPLKIVNFAFQAKSVSKSHQQQAQLSGRLRQALMIKIEESYVSRPLQISNLIYFANSFEPTLTNDELSNFKQQLFTKLQSKNINSQVLDTIQTMIRLQSYSIQEVIEIYNILCKVLQQQLNDDMVYSILKIVQTIIKLKQQKQLQKFATFLKYKYCSKNKQLDIKHQLKYIVPNCHQLPLLPQNQLNPKQIKNTLNSITKYNQLVNILSKLQQNKNMVETIWNLFIKNKKKNINYMSQAFKTLIKLSFPAKIILRNIMDSILITSDQVCMFESLFDSYKKLNYINSISECWLCQDLNPQNLNLFLNHLNQVIESFHQGYNPSISNHKNFKTLDDFEIKHIKEKNIIPNRQLLINNLSFHKIILQLLQSNYYLLHENHRNKKNVIVFRLCFQFLYGFCYKCTQNKLTLKRLWHILQKYNTLYEVGQTQLYVQFYNNDANNLRTIKNSEIQQFILKIVKNTKNKQNQNCQFNPQFLKYFDAITKFNGNYHRKNLQRVYKSIQKLNVLRKICFINQRTNSNQLCLDLFRLKNNPTQVPFIYHIRILKLLNSFIQGLQSLSSNISKKVTQMFSLDYMLKLLSEDDIYTSFGAKSQMMFLLKKEIYKLIYCHLDKNSSSSKLINNQHLINLINYYQNIFIKKIQRIQQKNNNGFLYASYIKQFKLQINFHQSNLRTHYKQDIKPLLIKIIQVINKIDKENKCLNILNDLTMIRLQELSESYEFRQQTKNIDFVNFKWRNFIDEDHSQEEKFAKGITIKCLRSYQSQQILIKQRHNLYTLLEKDINGTIKAFIELLIMNIDTQPIQDNPQANVFQIEQILKKIYDYLNDQFQDHNKKIIKSLLQNNFIQKIIDFINKSTFNYNKSVYRRILSLSLNILNFMIQNTQDNQIQKVLFKIFNENILSYRFFNYLKQSINVIYNRLDGEKSFQHINNALSQLYFCVEEKSTRIDQDVLNFITNLCNYIPFTTYLRKQSLTDSVDFLEKMYNTLSFVLYKQTDKIKLSVATIDAAEDLLVSMTAMMRGGNKSNQNYLIDSKLGQIICQILKIHQMAPFRSKQEIFQSQRLMNQTIEFYEENGVLIKNDLNRTMKIIDFTHPYLLNRLKYSTLKILLECLAGNQKAYNKIRVKIPIQLLKVNIIWIYDDFKKGQFQYTEKNLLRQKLPWNKIIDQQNLNEMFLIIGFYFFQLIENLTINQKQKQEQQDLFSDDREKAKKKVVMNFFSTISQKQKKIQKIQKLQNHQFAQQMKQFYQQYYQAIQFFSKSTLTIEVNFNDSLTKIYFPKLPICNKLTDEMKNTFINESVRISQEQKIKSLIKFEKQFYEILNGEEIFFTRISKKGLCLSVILGNLSQQKLTLLSAILAFITTICFLFDNFGQPSFDFSQQILAPVQSLSRLFLEISRSLTLAIAALLAVFLFANKIPVYYTIYKDIQKQRNQNERQIAGIFKYPSIFILKGLFSQSIYLFFLIAMMVGTFIHPLFAGFVMLQIINRMQLGKQVVRSLKETWIQLLAASFILIFFNYLYSMYNYVNWSSSYAPTCQSVYQCLLFTVNQSLKVGSGYLGIVPTIYQMTGFSFKFLTDLLYVVFAQKVVGDIFAGTIIDKFSQIRQEKEQMEADQQSFCFICGQQRFTIDFQLQGFQQHTQINHNPINYIYYLFYIRRKAKAEYGIVESYVYECLMKKKNHWIPINTSISKVQKQEEYQEVIDDKREERLKQLLNKKIKQLKALNTKCQSMILTIKNQNKK